MNRAAKRLVVACVAVAAADAWVVAATSDESLQSRANQLCAEARELEIQGDPARALRKYQAVVKAYPGTESAPLAQYQIGRLYDANKEYQNAFDAYQAVVSKFPASDLFLECLEAQFAIAREVLARLDYKERREAAVMPVELPKAAVARDMLRLILQNAKFAPFIPDVRYFLGVAYLKEQNPDEARAEFENLAGEFAGEPVGRNAAFQLAYMKFIEGTGQGVHRGILKQAREEFQFFLLTYPGTEKAPEAAYAIREIDRMEVAYLTEAARYYERMGRPDAARTYYAEIGKYAAVPVDDATREKVSASLGEAPGEPAEQLVPKPPQPPIILRNRSGAEPVVIRP